MQQILGCDVSHWQGNIDWKKVKKSGKEFAIIKCTEATNFFDDKFSQNKKNAREAGVLCGYYHFARGGDAKKEASWFLQHVGDLQEGEIIALDYEIYTLADPAKWCREWLDAVQIKVGFKPLLYTYHALLLKYDWKKVSEEGYGLWAARYGLQEKTPNNKYLPSTGTWKNMAMWQFCSRGSVSGISGNVDLNVFYGSIDQLKKYGSHIIIKKDTMLKEFVDAVEAISGEEYGDNLEEKNQQDAAKKLKEFKQRAENLQNELEDAQKSLADCSENLAIQENTVNNQARTIAELTAVKDQGVAALGVIRLLQEAFKQLINFK